MKTASSRSLVSAFGLAGLALLAVGCPQSGDGSSSASSTGTAAGPSGDSVGAPECDEVLKQAAAPGCKDKPGMSAIAANRENWKNGVANATTKDATIQACKATMDTIKAVCSGAAPPGTGTPGASGTGSPAAGGSDESVGAPECDDALKKAAAPSCKDKPGISAIAANRANWKNGLANAMTKDATIQACKAVMDTLKAAGCDDAGAAGATGAWDGKAPYECKGDDKAVITGVTANIAKGPAISAAGNCNVTFKDCTITTDKGVAASGNAVVTLEGGELKASDTAIEGLGAAQVTVKGTKVSGKVTTLGGAKVTGVPLSK